MKVVDGKKLMTGYMLLQIAFGYGKIYFEQE